MSNRGFQRSMNGINDIEVNEVQFPDGSTISSASNLVQLDTNNNFTAFNTFNVNLPTSTQTPTNPTDLTTKSYVDGLTDNNDFVTGFSRDAITGDITLTTADIGTPLLGSTSLTGITDAQLSQISTNATDIGNNTIAINTLNGEAVKLTGNQTIISGVKTFNVLPECSVTPTTAFQLVNKDYVDNNAGGNIFVVENIDASIVKKINELQAEQLEQSSIAPPKEKPIIKFGKERIR